jgi:hypothetical protein
MYGFSLNFWEVTADRERENGISVSLSNGVRKAKILGSDFFYTHHSIVKLKNRKKAFW